MLWSSQWPKLCAACGGACDACACGGVGMRLQECPSLQLNSARHRKGSSQESTTLETGALHASGQKREHRHTGNQEAHGFNATARLRWDSKVSPRSWLRKRATTCLVAGAAAALHKGFDRLHVFRAIFPLAANSQRIGHTAGSVSTSSAHSMPHSLKTPSRTCHCRFSRKARAFSSWPAGLSPRSFRIT